MFLNRFVSCSSEKRFQNNESIDTLESVRNENHPQTAALNPGDRRRDASNEPEEQSETHSLDTTQINMVPSAPDISAPPAYLEMDPPEEPPPAYSSLNLN